MNKQGIILINKPKNLTSRDVVNILCKVFNTKKIGHTGTLDPLATGVLVICIGKYTKLVDRLTSLEKEYIATIEFGKSTDTLDITGNILSVNNVKIFTTEEIIDAFNKCIGTYEQIIPLYSAKKINGKKMYEYARENIEIELPKKLVTVNNIELLSYDDNRLTFKATVSKGTFIRSLIQDICKSLNTIGTMSDLIRTKQGMFKLEDCFTLEDIQKENYQLLKVTDIFNYPTLEIDEEIYFKVINGNIISLDRNDDYIILKKEDELLAIYKKEDDIYKVDIMLI